METPSFARPRESPNKASPSGAPRSRSFSGDPMSLVHSNTGTSTSDFLNDNNNIYARLRTVEAERDALSRLLRSELVEMEKCVVKAIVFSKDSEDSLNNNGESPAPSRTSSNNINRVSGDVSIKNKSSAVIEVERLVEELSTLRCEKEALIVALISMHYQLRKMERHQSVNDIKFADKSLIPPEFIVSSDSLTELSTLRSTIAELHFGVQKEKAKSDWLISRLIFVMKERDSIAQHLEHALEMVRINCSSSSMLSRHGMGVGGLSLQAWSPSPSSLLSPIITTSAISGLSWEDACLKTEQALEQCRVELSQKEMEIKDTSNALSEVSLRAQSIEVERDALSIKVAGLQEEISRLEEQMGEKEAAWISDSICKRCGGKGSSMAPDAKVIVQRLTTELAVTRSERRRLEGELSFMKLSVDTMEYSMKELVKEGLEKDATKTKLLTTAQAERQHFLHVAEGVVAKGDETKEFFEASLKSLRHLHCYQKLYNDLTSWSRHVLARSFVQWKNTTVILKLQVQYNKDIDESRRGKSTSMSVSAVEVEKWRVKAQACERAAESSRRAENDAKEQMALYEDAFTAEKMDLSNQLTTAISTKIKLDMKIDELKRTLEHYKTILKTNNLITESDDEDADDDIFNNG